MSKVIKARELNDMKYYILVIGYSQQEGYCCSESLYFMGEDQLYSFFLYEEYILNQFNYDGIHEITLNPNDDVTLCDNGLYQVNRMYLGKRVKFVSKNLHTYINWENPDICSSIMKSRPDAIRYIKKEFHTVEMVKIVEERCPNFFGYLNPLLLKNFNLIQTNINYIQAFIENKSPLVFGVSFLFKAIDCNRFDWIEKYVCMGGNINECSKDIQWSVLASAIMQKSETVVNRIYNLGAIPDVCIKKKTLEIIRTFLTIDTSYIINNFSTLGISLSLLGDNVPVIAAYHNRRDWIAAYVRDGGNINSLSTSKYFQKYENYKDLFITHIFPEIISGKSALSVAALKRNTKLMSYLLENGARKTVAMKDKDINTIYTQSDYSEVIGLLKRSWKSIICEKLKIWS
jgi:hypothetical protein